MMQFPSTLMRSSQRRPAMEDAIRRLDAVLIELEQHGCVVACAVDMGSVCQAYFSHRNTADADGVLHDVFRTLLLTTQPQETSCRGIGQAMS